LVVNNCDVVVLFADTKISDKAQATADVTVQKSVYEVKDSTGEKSKKNEHTVSAQ
jgi:hypothetical protein